MLPRSHWLQMPTGCEAVELDARRAVPCMQIPRFTATTALLGNCSRASNPGSKGYAVACASVAGYQDFVVFALKALMTHKKPLKYIQTTTCQSLDWFAVRKGSCFQQGPFHILDSQTLVA